jgi:hypothetical protein
MERYKSRNKTVKIEKIDVNAKIKIQISIKSDKNKPGIVVRVSHLVVCE